MEKISLPTRTVSAHRTVVTVVTSVLVLLMLGWTWKVLSPVIAEQVYMKDFRQVLVTGRNVVDISDGQVSSEKTLFERGGLKIPTAGDAMKAFTEYETWDAEMPYLYARALWREYIGPADNLGLTRSRLRKESLPGEVALRLRTAIRRDPSNRFYRATLAGVLSRSAGGHPELETELNDLLALYSPQNAYGQIRTADWLRERKPVDRERVLQHYGRALGLVSADLNSGRIYMKRDFVTPPPRLDMPGLPSAPEYRYKASGLLWDYLVKRAMEGIIEVAGIENYARWAAVIPDEPQTHWVVARYLAAVRDRARSDASLADATQRPLLNARVDRYDRAARAEYKRLIDLVKHRLDVQAGISTMGYLWSILSPLSEVHRDRFLLGREIGYAAAVLRDAGDLDGAAELFRKYTAREPSNIAPRMALAKLLVARGLTLTDEAATLAANAASRRTRATEAKGQDRIVDAERLEAEARKLTAEAEEVKNRAAPYFEEADEQLSAVLRQKPRLAEALAERARISKAKGEE